MLLEFKLITNKSIKERSFGEIKVKDDSAISNTEGGNLSNLRLHPEGLYSEEIFGPLRLKYQNEPKYTLEQFEERDFRTGHIDFKFPIINPDLVKQSNREPLKKILGLENIDKETMEQHQFQSEDLLKSLLEGKLVLVIPKNLKPNKDEIQYIENNLVEIKLATATAIVEKYSELKEDKNSKKEGSIYVIKQELLTDVRYSDKGLFFWKKYFNILVSGYAVSYILSRIDLDYEIATIKKYNKYLEGKEIPYQNERLKYLIGIKKQKIELSDIITSLVEVIPAGLRDLKEFTDDNGRKSINISSTKDRVYRELIDLKYKIESEVLCRQRTLEFERLNWTNLDWTDELVDRLQYIIICTKAINEKIETLATSTKQDKLNDKYKKPISSVKSDINGKTGLLRNMGLGKRLDLSGRSVISVDPTIPFNTIGIPFKILSVFYKKALIARIKDELGITEGHAKNLIKITGDIKQRQSKVEIGGSGVEFAEIKNDVAFIQENSDFTLTNKVHKILETLVEEDYIGAIRYPSLHRYNFMTFKILITYSNSIKLHPLVCEPYNADFDGDQMSLFLVQTEKAKKEAKEKLMPIKNTIGANGQPIMVPTQDAILGLYYLTSTTKPKPKDFENITLDEYEKNKSPFKPKYYSSILECIRDYETNQISLEDWVLVNAPIYTESVFNKEFEIYKLKQSLEEMNKSASSLINRVTLDIDKKSDIAYEGNEIIINTDKRDKEFSNSIPSLEIKETQDTKIILDTVGRLIFNTLFPQNLGFTNREVDKYIPEINEKNGFYLNSGEDFGIPASGVKKLIKRVIEKCTEEEQIYIFDKIKAYGYKLATKSGLSLTIQDIVEKPIKEQEITKAKELVKLVDQNTNLTEEEKKEEKIKIWKEANSTISNTTYQELPGNNPLKTMSVSGARGNQTQLSQLMCMKGLLNDSSGNTIETPVEASFIQGLGPMEFYISSHGGRKGIFDRSSNTAGTGYNTRVMFYSTEEIISMGDCGDTEGYKLVKLGDGKYVKETGGTSINLEKIDEGKELISLFEKAKNRLSAETIYDDKGNALLSYNEKITDKHKDLIDNLDSLRVRSPLSCKAPMGICAKCYGEYLSRQRFARMGDPVGAEAALTFGERGTQLTMRTFHTGGVAEGDVTQGFDAIKKILEVKDGLLGIGNYRDLPNIYSDTVVYDKDTQTYKLSYGVIEETPSEIKLMSKEIQDKMEELKTIIRNAPEQTIQSVVSEIKKSNMKWINFGVCPVKNKFNKVLEMGDIQGIFVTMLNRTYIANNINGISQLHYEVLYRALSKVKVIDPGDSIKAVGDFISLGYLIKANIELLMKGLKPIIGSPALIETKRNMKNPETPLKSATSEFIGQNILMSAITNAEDNMMSSLSALMTGEKIPVGNQFMEVRDNIFDSVGPNYKELMNEPIDIIEFNEPENVVTEEIVTQEISFGLDNLKKKKEEEAYEEISVSDKNIQVTSDKILFGDSKQDSSKKTLEDLDLSDLI